MESVMDALQALASASPRELIRGDGEAGRSVLLKLHDLCVSAELAEPNPPDDVVRLHDLFTAALNHGMGGLVYDYIQDVSRACQGGTVNPPFLPFCPFCTQICRPDT
jgi:hypothetical protein